MDPMKGRHVFASDIREHMGFDRWNSAFKFAFVRNPWARLVSWYHSCLKEPLSRNEFHRYIQANTSCFEEFLNTTAGLALKTTVNQIDYVADSAGRPIVDFIGRFERLQQDFQFIGTRLQLPLTLPHSNKGLAVADYRSFYNDETRDLVARRFQRDIEIFRYTFD